MKNKKRVLTILLVLIVITAIILAIVLISGGIKQRKIKEYERSLEDAACKLVKDENYTKEICEAYDYLCRVHMDKLIARGYINSNLKNPANGKKTSEDTNSYVDVTWKEDRVICTYKEG